MNERNNKLELLGSAPIPKALMALGMPIMIGMLINALYNLVDAYFVSGLGKSQMGAISVVFPLGQVVVGLGLMFGNGAASYLSRLLGRGDKDTADKVAMDSGAQSAARHTIWMRMDSVSRMGKAAGKITERIRPTGTIKEMWRFRGQRGRPTPIGRWNLPADRSAFTIAATSGRALIRFPLFI